MKHNNDLFIESSKANGKIRFRNNRVKKKVIVKSYELLNKNFGIEKKRSRISFVRGGRISRYGDSSHNEQSD
jgi:hypothetical protein